MYKIVSIEDAELTRMIKLKNFDTGTVDVCFDDSALISDVNFNFIIIGGEYECKIKLFGKVVQNECNNAIECKVLSHSERVGNREMVKVLVERDEYYIPRKKIQNCIDKERFLFQYTRKDLIQVDDIIHQDLM